jgi:hypothetical protein
MKSIFEQKIEDFRKQFLSEEFASKPDPQVEREQEELSKVDGEVRKKKLDLKKKELDSLKQKEQNAKQHGSAL